MRYVIPCRVTVFIFSRVLLDTFELIGHSPFELVFTHAVLHHQFQTAHIRIKIVAGMLHIRTHPEVLRRLRLCEPVLSLDVITLLLLRCEGRSKEGKVGVSTQMACDRQRTKECSKEVTFLSIEIDTELLDVLKRSKVRFSVFWLKVITVF